MSKDGRVEYPNWFDGTGARENFELFLNHFKNQPGLRFLQLGVYTGDASVWLLEKILTDPTSTLSDVDTWQGSDEEAHKQLDFDDIYIYYLSRTQKYKNRYPYRTRTIDFLRYDDSEYDFIYIDADHTAVGVLLDAELSWDLLKPGGIMAFDDYEWKSGKGDEFDPGPGINTFLTRHQGQFRVIHKGWQVWLIKN